MKYKRSEQFDEPQVNKLECAAYGCNLPGAFCHHGTAQGYCRYHNEQDVADFDTISTRIRQSAPLRDHIHALKMNPWASHLYEYPRNTDFNKIPEENPFQYAYRLEQYVIKWVKDGLTPEEQIEKEKSQMEEFVTQFTVNE